MFVVVGGRCCVFRGVVGVGLLGYGIGIVVWLLGWVD